MPIKPRPLSIIVKLDAKEKEAIVKGAKNLGVSISDYVRYKLVHGGSNGKI